MGLNNLSNDIYILILQGNNANVAYGLSVALVYNKLATVLEATLSYVCHQLKSYDVFRQVV